MSHIGEVSTETVVTVKATVPVLKDHGTSIILKFYDILFERYPDVQKQFNSDRHRGGKSKESGVPSQVASLANAIMAYAKNIDKMEKLLPVVERICHKHISRGVNASQYDAVGECLIAAMKEVLADAATDEVLGAWTEAYRFLAATFIEMEKNLKTELEEKAGYSGFIDMEVVDVEEEEDGSKKLSIKPIDLPVPPHAMGQFIGIKVAKGEVHETMTSMMVVYEEREGLWISVPKCAERASIYLLTEVNIGSVLCVSVPAGKARRPIVDNCE